MTQPILTNPQELETWLDELMAEQRSKLHIPGVTFSLVQNGELFFAKGYGYADLEQQIPVIADRTLFCVGGISKLFTATAIMQLEESGLLNLDDDVNKYLPDFQIENNYPQPVTIANLLTHTAGFDNRSIGMGALETSDVIPLGEHLAARMPGRVRSPGEVIIGCNYSYGLLGYIVELVTGVPFSQYIDENILQPLEMNHSSFELPSHLAVDLALSYGYKEKQKTHQALQLNYHQILLTDSLNATATDLANFAIAHLQHGRFKAQRILSEATAQQMQQQQFTNDPRLPGVGLGFWEYFNNQQRAIAHSGGVVAGFRSFLYLLPSQNLGLFVAENGSSNISGKLIDQFLDLYFPVEESSASLQPSPENQQSLHRYEGSYRNCGYPKRTLAKALLLFSSPLRLKAEPNGTLSIPQTLKTANPVYFREVEQLLLAKATNRHNFMVAKESNNGKITDLLYGSGAFKKLAWYETNTFHWMLIGWFILVFLSGCIVSILALTRFSADSWHQWTQLLAGLTCLLNLVCAFGMLIVYRLTKNNYRLKLVYGLPKIVILLLCIPLLTSVLAVGLPVFAVLAWINNEWSFIEQLYYALVALTALGFVPFLNYWNLLGFRY